MTAHSDRRTFLRRTGLVTAGAAAAGLLPARQALAGTRRVANLPDSFYARPGLEGMPRIDYASMPVVNVRDYGATGDGHTPERAAFDRAVDALDAQGGGIVYVPPGRYVFPPPAAPTPYHWRRTLHNIHFVGEGEDSAIVFEQPAIGGGDYGHVQGWSLGNSAELSFRALSFSWTPYYLARNSKPHYTLSFSQQDRAQFVGVTVDQGQPGIWMNQGKGYWVVDCVLRNVAADAIHFESCSDSVAAYNWVENCYDDCVGNVTNTRSTPDPSILTGVRFVHNTVVFVPWGRGVTLGGAGQVTEHNWVEAAGNAGIFSTVGGFADWPPAPLYDSFVRDNVVIRGNLAQREDNAFYRFGTGGFQAALAVMMEVRGLTLERNRVYGSEVHGMTFGFDGWYPVTGTDFVVRDNDVQDTTESGIHVEGRSTIDGIVLEDNKILDTGTASVLVDGDLTAATSDGNLVSTPPVVNGSVAGDFDGFTVKDVRPSYRDVYREFRRAGDETGWEEPPALPATLPRTVDVRSFGARGDGRANDLQAFAKALASLPATGGVLRVPAGRYRLDPLPGKDSLAFTRIRHHLLVAGRSNVHVRGDGDNSVLVFGSADHQGLRFVDVENCSVSGLRLELRSQPTVRRNRALLEFSAARSSVVSGVTAVRSSGPGIRIDSSRGVRVSGCRVEQAGTYGIELAACRQTVVEGCDVRQSRDNAIETSWVGSIEVEPQYVRISGNRVDGTREGAGIGVVGGHHVVVDGNDVRSTYLAGLYVYERCSHYPPKRIELTGNTLTGVNGGRLSYLPGAIAVHGLSEGRTSGDLAITGNTISGTPYAGVWVGGPTPVSADYSVLDRLVVSGNTFSGVGATGIAIDDQQRALIQELVIE
ncbi:right-handed parallel beta-helix repeat-containing protein [Flindersiella endophytica]